MKLAVAQLRSIAGDIDYNVRRHEALLSLAASRGADLIIFPELSLTNYEPQLARGLVMSETDSRIENLQAVSDRHGMVIGVGMPTAAGSDVRISMLYLQPGKEAATYSKQHLHEDELPYFVEGTESIVLSLEREKLVPAICYESLLPKHAEQAAMLNASVYLASVAKPEGGVERGAKHYPMIARQHSMIV
ncbi:MAG: carbon-nitrogen hydrolase family protein, partial [Candidatus Kapaibacterium sp.]